jgi:hypothetical protein
MSHDASLDGRLRYALLGASGNFRLAPLTLDALSGLLKGNPKYPLSTVLDRWLFETNTFAATAPVTGSAFFGRDSDLEAISRAVLSGGHVGVFGLRKIGKTSLVQEWMRRLGDRSPIRAEFLDLQASSPHKNAAHVAWRIARTLSTSDALGWSDVPERIRGDLATSKEYTPAQEQRYVAKLADSLRVALARIPATSRARLVLILDEIDLMYAADDPLPGSDELLRALRAVAQESKRLTIIVVGVNSLPCERPLLGGKDNPLFGLLDIRYLGALDPADAEKLILEPSKRMGLVWKGKSHLGLVTAVGRHPLLLRLGASEIAETNSQRPASVVRDDVTAVVRGFPRSHTAHFTEIVSSLRRYYPQELDLLEMLASEDRAGMAELVDSFPSETNHLVGCGVLDAKTFRIGIPVFKTWLQTYANPAGS